MRNNLLNLWYSHKGLVLSIGYKLGITLFIIALGIILSRILKKVIKKQADRIKGFDQTLTPLLLTISNLSVFILGIVIILDIFGVNTNSIVALLGAAGLAVGLALKDTLSNIASGIMLIVLRPFSVGDYIESSSGAGSVQKLGLFTTVLKTPDGLFVSIPNSNLWGSSIKNYTKNGIRRMDIKVGISYDDSIDTAFEVMNNISKDEKRFLDEPATPVIMVHSMGDSSVNIQLRAWANNSDYWDIYWNMNKKVKEEIEKAGLTIPFPQTDVHIKKDLS